MWIHPYTETISHFGEENNKMPWLEKYGNISIYERNVDTPLCRNVFITFMSRKNFMLSMVVHEKKFL